MLQTLYRGTQRRSMEGVRPSMSFAYSLPVAIIWSARPGDIWASRKPAFLPTSTIHVVQVDIQKPLNLGGNHTSLDEVIRALGYGTPQGITEEEVRKVYNYLHNRLTGKTKGGEFSYLVVDEYGDPLDEKEVPFSLRSPYTLIRLEAEDAWDYEPTLDTASHLIADTFIFADAPAVQRAALQLGYDAIIYQDVFQGGDSAARDLLGMDVYDLEGIKEEEDLDDEFVPVHWTLRPIDPSVIVSVESIPTAEVLAQLAA